MKSTGIVRQMDNLGRIVIPIELRRTLQIDKKDPIEIFVEGDRIILRRHEAACVFCGSTDGITAFKKKYVCSKCVSQMSNGVS
ncbi:MAG: AbrB/MazE/SpoVT family DNA-binding domain-containing protein [Firmicutes bacterium]|jgi:transcriptional pleiotropic regulator of transition state genes|nr:AbrB/MazE/SpoVT family DNA-binding domain-containing protein [Bacillota bacterium]